MQADVSALAPSVQVPSARWPVEGAWIDQRFGLRSSQQLQVITLPGRIELVPSQPPTALRGFLSGENTFEREVDRL